MLVGLTAAAVPVARISARSSSSMWMQCAYTARGRSRAELFVDAQIAAGLRVQPAHPGDFVLVLGDVRLYPHVRVFGGQLAGAAQLGFAAAGHKTRRDGITSRSTPCQRWIRASVSHQALRGVVTHALGRVLVHQAFAGHQAQAAVLRFGEQGIDGFGMRGGKGQRGGDAVAQQLVQEKTGGLRAVRGIREAAFLRKGGSSPAGAAGRRPASRSRRAAGSGCACPQNPAR